jgi:phosphoribosylaminoimidazole-succinocarboxamide synthase
MTHETQDLRREVAMTKEILRVVANETGDPEIVECVVEETDFKRCVVRVAMLAKEKAAHVGALKALISEYQARIDRMEHAEERLRRVIAQAMQDVGMTKIAEPEMTISLRAGNQEVILQDTTADATMREFFPAFVKEKVTYSFDKTAIRQALESGASVPFARLGNAAPVLSIRVK